jgi:isoquinoline 1-oxidoreductase beta subunit
VKPVNLTRRGFVTALGGLVLGFSLPGCSSLLPPIDGTIGLGADPGALLDINAWIRIAPDNTVSLRMGASEMGQGVFTSLPMILAEELDVDWSLVHAESAPAAKVYRHLSIDYPGSTQLTGGSLSVRGYFEQLRRAGASARAMLVRAAADQWGVSTSDCRTEAGYVLSGDNKLSYGQLAQAASLLPAIDAEPKPAGERKLLGTSPARLDLPPKVNGTATFGIDVQPEGCVNATIVQCPHFGGSLVSFDDSAAREVPGVLDIFEEDGAIVVIADTFWHARKASTLLQIEWDAGEGAGLDDARIGELLQQALDGGGKTLWKVGKVGETDIEAVYEVPYLEHAPIEPLNATAWVREGRVDVWAPTQAQQTNQMSAARIAGVHVDDVFIHTTFLGGGFGRKSFNDFVDWAVKVAMHLEQPVKVTWTREECFKRGQYRPRSVCRMRAKLGEDGYPTDLSFEMASQNVAAEVVPGPLANLKPVISEVIAGGLAHNPYSIPNQRVDVAVIDLPVPVGWWRSVQGSNNGFYRECFLDELANAAGIDPIAYRRKLLADSPRHLAVFEAAVQAAGPTRQRQSRGVALFESFGSLCAQVADVSVVDGQLTIHRVAAAMDCGTALHPDGVKSQVMGALTMGISSMLREGLSLKDGAVEQQNFHEYELLKLAEAPQVTVVIVDSGEELGGVGEPGLPPVLGAVCNAIAAATGTRIRSLPLGEQLQG